MAYCTACVPSFKNISTPKLHNVSNTFSISMSMFNIGMLNPYRHLFPWCVLCIASPWPTSALMNTCSATSTVSAWHAATYSAAAVRIHTSTLILCTLAGLFPFNVRIRCYCGVFNEDHIVTPRHASKSLHMNTVSSYT